MVRLDAAPLGPLTLDATFLVELVAFLIMLGILARWVYPPIMRAAEARQKQIADQLAAAETARSGAEEYLSQTEASLQEARVEGQRIIEAARRAAEQVAQQGKERAEDEARRILEQAERDIEAERQRTLQGLRAEVVDLALLAAGRVIGESLDGPRQRQLVERTIEEAELSV